MPQNTDPKLLVGSATADDAGVYKISEDLALVQTLDFFTPIVDDPYLFGQIAAANSLSDVYAMGGRPLTAMAIAGMPTELLNNDEIAEIFRGGADMIKLANCSLVGGHTIKNPEPIYGLSVTGVVHPDKFLANAHAQDGDVLLLTKPLGTGIISTALKKGACSDELSQASITAMITLNTAGAELGEQKIVNACTDVTGFGLLGHLKEVADASKLTAIIDTKNIPAIGDSVYDLIEAGFVPAGSKKNLVDVSPYISFSRSVSRASQLLMADAQTSGGLLLSVSPTNVSAVVKILEAHNSLCVTQIGNIVKRQDFSIVGQ